MRESFTRTDEFLTELPNFSKFTELGMGPEATFEGLSS
jgi:hypothetical protein